MLIRGAEVDGAGGVDVRIAGGLIVAVGAGLDRSPGEPALDAHGGALLPGLHDHHVHLRAWAATRWSVRLAGADGPDDFDRRVREAAAVAPPDVWLRGVGWHESTGGPLDRHRLDALTGGRPTRIQHRTGALWILNSAALLLTGAAGSTVAGIERDASGEPTGRLWRADDWLRDRTATVRDPFPVALADLARQAAQWGVTRWTDATPDRDQTETNALAALWTTGLPSAEPHRADAARLGPDRGDAGQAGGAAGDHAEGGLPRLVLMSPPGLSLPDDAVRVTLGPQKLVLDDATLPPVAELAATIRESHAAGSPVAVHCVTAEQLVTLVAAIEEADSTPGDRVEHAGIVPPGYAARLAALGLAVVTNPGFLADRGDAYRRDVPEPERDWLYPVRSLRAAGVPVAAATDAPFGPADPWVAIAAAVDRRTPDGAVLGPDERVTATEALDLFLADPDRPGRRRRIAPGHPADLCLLHTPLAPALAAPSSDYVRAVLS
ncbi:amidohydrolase family protein [Cryptosporangium aurantiacum]|uniref:Predicted amidohydrolase YtcJ n=1 Tax=Cryptosporangium aurantiacum TaxID=134849 RepID=A0A1M7RLS5_9ACTN|nr:amidohydrolase family protein [Cryptosporangium aurantiacum]SHN47139.1 Predicted amidohydrolase YtcJ [Cryptosporangium aurantiacum]